MVGKSGAAGSLTQTPQSKHKRFELNGGRDDDEEDDKDDRGDRPTRAASSLSQGRMGVQPPTPKQKQSSPKLIPIVAPAGFGIRCNLDVHLKGCKLPFERFALGCPTLGAICVDHMLYDEMMEHDDYGTS